MVILEMGASETLELEALGQPSLLKEAGQTSRSVTGFVPSK